MFRTQLHHGAALVFALVSVTAIAQPPNSVKITNQSGSAQTNRPFTISRVFAKGDIPHFAQAVVGGTAVATQSDVKTRWPDGSVQHALISFVASLPAGNTITVGFVDQPSGNNAGAMNRAAMLAANWGAQIEVTNGSTLTANARQIVTDWSGGGADARVTYWLQGPICTQVILEDRTPTLTYDIGWDTYKPLHPIFVVTFYPGTSAGVKVEMILENMWTTKLEDQTYSLALKTGNPLGAPVYTKPSLTQNAGSRWRKTYWSGAQPGSVNVDYNLPYMISSQAVPNWDLSKTVPFGSVSSDVTSFNASDQGDIGGHALWAQQMGASGGRPDLGVFPAWYVRYLFTFDPGEYNMLLGMAAAGAYVPIHFRESDSSRYFDSGKTVNAFGLPLSLDARPTAADGFTPVGPISQNGWGYDLAHEPGFAYIPYLITGDWYFLEELYFQASTALRQGPGYCPYCRGDSWGYISFAAQTRGQAWGLRDIGQTAFATPDGTPQKAYYTQKLNFNIEIEEGQQGVTNGSFPPSDPTCAGYVPGPTASRWCYGHVTISTNPDPPYNRLKNTLNFPNYGNAYSSCADPALVPPTDPDACHDNNSPWQVSYKLNVMGHLQELGFAVAPLNQAEFRFLLHEIQDPAYNPFLVGGYVMPIIKSSTGDYFQTWGDVLNGFSTNFNCGGQMFNLRTYQGWAYNCPGAGGGDSNTVAPGYPHLAKGAASYLAGLNINDGSLLGVNAWNWTVANVGYQGAVGLNPQYAILPRNLASRAVSSCDLNSDGVVDVQDVQISIKQALGQAACTSADLVGNGTCSVVDVQRITDAALGQSCRLGP